MFMNKRPELHKNLSNDHLEILWFKKEDGGEKTVVARAWNERCHQLENTLRFVPLERTEDLMSMRVKTKFYHTLIIKRMMTNLKALKDQEPNKKKQCMTANIYVRTLYLRTESERMEVHHHVNYQKEAFLCSDIVVLELCLRPAPSPKIVVHI